MPESYGEEMLTVLVLTTLPRMEVKELCGSVTVTIIKFQT